MSLTFSDPGTEVAFAAELASRSAVVSQSVRLLHMAAWIFTWRYSRRSRWKGALACLYTPGLLFEMGAFRHLQREKSFLRHAPSCLVFMFTYAYSLIQTHLFIFTY